MKRRLFTGSILAALAILVAGTAASAQDSAQKKPVTPTSAILDNWNDVGNRIVAMAEDWPEDKYGYRPNADVRSFADVMRHIAGSNYEMVNMAVKKKLGVEGDNPPADQFKTKAQIVDYLKKSVADGATAIQQSGDAEILKHLDYWTEGIVAEAQQCKASGTDEKHSSQPVVRFARGDGSFARNPRARSNARAFDGCEPRRDRVRGKPARGSSRRDYPRARRQCN